MECPHCGKELDIGFIPYSHMERYGQRILAATECCGKGVVCEPFLSYRVTSYSGQKEEDDWGTPFDKARE